MYNKHLFLGVVRKKTKYFTQLEQFPIEHFLKVF